MGYNPGYWKPGEKVPGSGRPAGARNNRTTEIIQQIVAAGHKDPLLTLAELQANSQDEAIRATAANMLAPYIHAKNATKPVQPDPVYIQEAISLPAPSTIRQAAENIYRLTEMKSTGKLDIATADSLINDQKVILYALIDEAKLLAAQGGSPEQTIHIEGGLPRLPGTSVIMPSDPPYEPGFQDPGMELTPAKANGGHYPDQGPPPTDQEP
jgi:hypothetical protein